MFFVQGSKGGTRKEIGVMGERIEERGGGREVREAEVVEEGAEGGEGGGEEGDAWFYY